MLHQDFYNQETAEKVLGGPEEYRAEVYDDSGNYEVHIYDVGRYGGQWFVIQANGCSCWSGEYYASAGPFATVEEVREYIRGEFVTVGTDYYADLRAAWEEALDNAAQAV